MPDYQKMYAILCGAISDALEALPMFPENEEAIAVLCRASEQAETIYIESTPM